MPDCRLFTTHIHSCVAMGPSTPLQLLLLLFLTGRSQAANAVLVDANLFATGNELNNNEDLAAASDAFIRSEIISSAASFNPAEELEIWEENDDDRKNEATKVEANRETTFTVPPTPGPIASAPLDALVDFVIQAFDYIMTVNHTTKMPVPDFNQEFRTKIGFIKVHGHITATGGELGDLSSLFRDGSVTVRPLAPNKLLLEGSAGLRYLRATFSRYSARAGPVRVSGTLQATMSPATVRCVLELSPPCHLVLSTLTINHLGPLKLQVTGLGILRRLMPLLQRWIQKRMRADAEKFLQGHLAQMIRDYLRVLSC